MSKVAFAWVGLEGLASAQKCLKPGFCRYFAKVCFKCGHFWREDLVLSRVWPLCLRWPLLGLAWKVLSLPQNVLKTLVFANMGCGFWSFGLQLWSKLALPHLSLRMWAVALCFFLLFFRLLSFLFAFFLSLLHSLLLCFSFFFLTFLSLVSVSIFFL